MANEGPELRLLNEQIDKRINERMGKRPVDSGGGPPHDSGMEARVARLEDDVKEIKAALGRLEPSLSEMNGFIHATLPALATRADLARLPSAAGLWGMIATVIAVALAMVGVVVALTGPFARTETVREIPAAQPPQVIYIQPQITPAPTAPVPTASPQ